MGIPHGDRQVGRSIEMFTRFYLLPHVEVARPQDADVVLALARDPRSLGLHYSAFWAIGHGVYAARIARG
jgi:hypothetical protein